MTSLSQRLQKAGRGEGGVVLVSGEPGIGKTRLLAEFSARRARQDGWLVLSGRAYDTEGMPPYLPFADALRQHLSPVADEDLATQLGEALPYLELLLPELRTRVPEDASVHASPGDPNRHQLFEAVGNVLAGISRGSECRGLLLWLDDLHWADESTLLLLQHIARRLKGLPILIAGSYRTVEVDPSRPFLRFLDGFAGERLCEQLMLAPLSYQDACALAESLGFNGAPAAMEAIHRRTQGNPFFIEEVVRHVLSQDLQPAALESSTGVIPEGVRQVISTRVLKLSPEAQRLLQAGAILGDGFEFEIAVPVSGLEEQAAIEALDQAIAAGLIREHGEVCSFCHPLIHRTIYDGLSGARRRILHLQAAEAIEAAYSGHLEPHLSVLAVNYRLAGARAELERAIDYSLRAGAAAQQALAYELARSHWEAALELMERHMIEPSRRAELSVRLGELLNWVGFAEYALSARHFEQAITLFEQVGAAREAAATHARLGLLLGAGGPINDNNAALAHLRAAEPLVSEGPASEAQLWLYSGLGLIAVWQIEPDKGLAASAKGMEIALQVGREDMWVGNAIQYSFHLHAKGQMAGGMALLERAWQTGHRLNNPFRAGTAAGWAADRLLELGDPLLARRWLEREVDEPRELQVPSRLRAMRNEIMATYARVAELAVCREMQAEYDLTSRKREMRPFPIAELELGEGNWEAAQATCTGVRERALASGFTANLPRANYYLARVCQLSGDFAEAIDLLLEEQALGIGGPHVLYDLEASAELAILCTEAGRPAEAQAHLARCRAILAGGEDWHGLAGRVALAEAVVAANVGDTQEAESHFSHALAIFDTYTLPWDRAETLLQRGRMYGTAGRRQRFQAVEDFEAAIEIYKSHGAGQRWIDRAVALKAGAQVGGAAPRQVYADGLTEREVEVVRLVAAGKSSREIGEELVLSVRTVDRHIANVYLKTETHGRAQITAYALRHGYT